MSYSSRLRSLGNAVGILLFTAGTLVWSVQMNRRSLAFAFWIIWALMGIAFVVWMFVPLRFGSGYYRVHDFERSGRLYERLGVRAFQRFLRAIRFHGPRPFPHYDRRAKGEETLVASTLNPETAHLLIFGIVNALAVDSMRRGWWDTAAWMLLFNIPLNVYPVLSMRYVRARAKRLFSASVAARRA